MTRRRFASTAPFLLKFIFGLTIVNGVVWFLLAGWTNIYGLPRPAGSWVYPVHFKHGVVVYVPHALGLYISDGLWVELLLLIIGTVLSRLFAPRRSELLNSRYL